MSPTLVQSEERERSFSHHSYSIDWMKERLQDSAIRERLDKDC